MRLIIPLFALSVLVACDDDTKATADTTTTPDTSEGALCAKYGGAAMVDQVVKTKIIPAIAGDCRINTFFTALSSDGLNHVVECLSTQVQALFGCAGVRYSGSLDSRGAPCRDMRSVHLGLQLSQGDFDALIDDVVQGLTAAGVEESDINTAAPALLGMAPDIVAQPDHNDPTHGVCE